jgi:hypothetical protein
MPVENSDYKKLQKRRLSVTAIFMGFLVCPGLFLLYRSGGIGNVVPLGVTFLYMAFFVRRIFHRVEKWREENPSALNEPVPLRAIGGLGMVLKFVAGATLIMISLTWLFYVLGI